MNEHRIRTSPVRTLLLALVAAVLGFALALLVIHPTSDTKAAAQKTRTVTKTVTVQVPAPTVGPYKAARAIKPLAGLEKGDRVLFAPDATSFRQSCTWVYWNGSIDYAAIDCGKGTQIVKTGFLTPVEAK